MAGRKNSSGSDFGGIPRVRLLPPDVSEKRAQQGRTRVLVAVVVIVAVLVAGVYGLTVVQAGSAQASLATAQSQSAALLAQQSTYAPAKTASDAIAQIDEALKVTTSSEVLWSDLYAVVQKHIPAGDNLINASMTGRAPFEPTLPLQSPIDSPKVAIIVVKLNVTSPDDAAAFIQSLQQEDIVSGVTLVTFSGASGQNEADFRVDFNVRALSHRFATAGASK
jgi:hypothetical protein